jgi:SAM-dependent methyltransferase
MTNFSLDSYVPPLVLQHLTEYEINYLIDVLSRLNGFPTLEQMWVLLDEPWDENGCDPFQMDNRVTAFYQHPVWLLNGLFIEQHEESLINRRAFTNWVLQQQPARVADFGGGFGGLARFIGHALPDAQVEVVDPHPHPAAIAVAASTPNVRFVPKLTGEYDLLIATDVFEHVPDPIELAEETAEHLRLGGQYLIANCFQPVIKCHLPQLFYFQIAWDASMSAMGLQPGERVSYGRVYKRSGVYDVLSARRVAGCAKRIWPLVEKLPRGRAKLGSTLVNWFCR